MNIPCSFFLRHDSMEKRCEPLPVVTGWSSMILFGFVHFTCCFMENVGGSCIIFF